MNEGLWTDLPISSEFLEQTNKPDLLDEKIGCFFRLLKTTLCKEIKIGTRSLKRSALNVTFSWLMLRYEETL